MSTTLKLYSQQPNGVTFSDPTDPDYTIRFKTNASPKIINGLRTTNYVHELIINEVAAVSGLGDGSSTEALSVRLRTSGSLESIPALKAMVSDLAAQLDQWLTEDILVGFPPATAPVRNDLE